MSFVIRSANGQRSVSKTMTNANKDLTRVAIREELVEALRGLTIKFEVRIQDVILPEDDSESEQKAEKQDGPTFASRAGDILTELKAKPLNDQQQVPSRALNGQIRQEQQQQTRPAPSQAIDSQIRQEPQQQSRPAPSQVIDNQTRQEPQQQTRPAPSQVIDNQIRQEPQQQTRPALALSAIRPAIGRQKPPPTVATRGRFEEETVRDERVVNEEPKIQPGAWLAKPVVGATKPVVEATRPVVEATRPVVETTKSVVEATRPVVETTKPVVEATRPVVEAAETKANKLLDVPSKTSKPNSGTLVKCNPKIGSILKTCCVFYDVAQEPAVPYIALGGDILTQITTMIADMAASIESQPPVSSIDVGAIVFAKSHEDDCWYRSIVERVRGNEVDLYLFDWGFTDTLDLSRIRHLTVLELGLSKNPALALKIKVKNPPGPLVDQFYESITQFDVRIDAYDEFDDTYAVTLLRSH